MSKDAILHIKDEVNIQFKDVDPVTRRKLSNALKYIDPAARYTPAVRLGRWDGSMSFCDIGGRSYFHLLDRLLPIVIDAGYNIVVQDDRHPIKIDLPAVDINTFSHIMWPKGHPVEGTPVILRDYQAEIIDKFMADPQCLQVIPTGAGKTLISAALSYQVEKYGRSIVIVPSKDLVTQTEADYKNLGLDVGVYFGDRKEYQHTHTICTWQSLERLIQRTKDIERETKHMSDLDKAEMVLKGTCWACAQPTHKHSPHCLAVNGDIYQFVNNVNTVIVDECHRVKGDVLRKQLSSVFANVPIRWGFTGTMPEREADEVGVTCAIGPLIGKLSSKELQDKGILANLDISVMQLQDPLLAFPNYAAELKWLTTDAARIKAIESIIEKTSHSGNTLILVDRIATGKMLVKHNPDWVFVSGATKSSKRKDEYDNIKHANNQVIIGTYGIISTGIDIPRIFNLILFEPGKSFVRVIQSIGRGIRKAKDKDYVNIIDLCSSHKYSKRHLTSRKKFYKNQEFPFKVFKINY